MPSSEHERKERYTTYLTLIGLFLALFAGFSLRKRPPSDGSDLRPFDLALLGLAAYRAGRLLAYDKVTEPLRAPFTETKPHASGAGEVVIAQGTGMRRALGELIACPICSGTWVAAMLVYGLDIAPRTTRILLAILAASGAAEMLDASVEALYWTSQAARNQAGSRAQSSYL